jgi:predicted nucleic acid-binding protein
MILVDTSVWIDHLHTASPRLVDLLDRDEVAVHPMVIEELALGSIKDRGSFLESLNGLRTLTGLSHVEAIELVTTRQLWGRGLSAVDVHLLGSVMVSPGFALWTRDKRLKAVAAELGVSLVGRRGGP